MSWICDYDMNLFFRGVEQLSYQAKLLVKINRLTSNVDEVEVNRNTVIGFCCKNELNIRSSLKFCEDFTCKKFLSSPITIVRK